MTEEKRSEIAEINFGLQALKKLAYFLILMVLALSAALNFFILQSNQQLQQRLTEISRENSQLRYERNLLEAFVREMEEYARNNAEAEKIISKYRVQKRSPGTTDRDLPEEKP